MVMCLGEGREMTAATAAKAAAGSGLSAVGCSRSAAAMMMLTSGGVQYGFPPVYWEEPSCGQCVRRGGGSTLAHFTKPFTYMCKAFFSGWMLSHCLHLFPSK